MAETLLATSLRVGAFEKPVRIILSVRTWPMARCLRNLSTKSALWIFVVCCLLSSARLAVNSATMARDSDDIAWRSGQRFAALREALPKRGVIGYVGQTDGVTAVGDYYVTQYALAPLVVDDSRAHAIVIGNFPSSRPSQFPRDLELLKDFGHGVLLFANRDAR
jgi:hypothetical protein